MESIASCRNHCKMSSFEIPECTVS